MAKAKVFVIYYSTYGHVQTLAQAVMKGVLKSGEVDAEIYQISETLSDDVLEKMNAAEKLNVPEITAEKLVEADGFLFGFPTRFGTAPAQVKAFFDSTGKLWSQGALAGKPVGLFFSTASQHGGQEATAFSFMPHFAHHGMVYVSLGYPSDQMRDNSAVMGGSPWGCGTVAGPNGERTPQVSELDIATIQGEKFAVVAAKLAAPASATDQAAAAAVPAAAQAEAQAEAPAPTEQGKTQQDAGAQQTAAQEPPAKREGGGRVKKAVAKLKSLFS
ncbi:hypothetical protein H4217_007686 [Coemansia sp. RSA 1939]|nr:hypothetical protein H4217_007686 [Coemansia sp. RSA 1939]KAJ2694739.1 hypothetical protein GGH99_000515 [Coemansia sp. RSA 1285]